jgi:hypothetical protein
MAQMRRMSKEHMNLWASKMGKKDDKLTEKEIQSAAETFITAIKDSEKSKKTKFDPMVLNKGQVHILAEQDLTPQLKAKVDNFNRLERGMKKTEAAKARIKASINKQF